MNHLSQLLSTLPLAVTAGEVVYNIVFVIGLITLALIVVFIILCLTMMPDFARYLKIKRM